MADLDLAPMSRQVYTCLDIWHATRSEAPAGRFGNGPGNCGLQNETTFPARPPPLWLSNVKGKVKLGRRPGVAEGGESGVTDGGSACLFKLVVGFQEATGAADSAIAVRVGQLGACGPRMIAGGFESKLVVLLPEFSHPENVGPPEGIMLGPGEECKSILGVSVIHAEEQVSFAGPVDKLGVCDFGGRVIFKDERLELRGQVSGVFGKVLLRPNFFTFTPEDNFPSFGIARNPERGGSISVFTYLCSVFTIRGALQIVFRIAFQ